MPATAPDGTVFNDALPILNEVGTNTLTLYRDGDHYAVDFGTLAFGSASPSVVLAVADAAANPSFYLQFFPDYGTFNAGDATHPFRTSDPTFGLNALQGFPLSGGSTGVPFTLSVDTTATGAHTTTLLIHTQEQSEGFAVGSTFVTLPTAPLPDLTLTLSVDVLPAAAQPDWNALAAEAAANFAATGHWFVGTATPSPAPSTPDWNVLAADAAANFAATGHWFLTPAAASAPPDWNALAATATANFTATGHWFL